MTRDNHYDLKTRERKVQAVGLATSVLNGTLGIIEGARELATLGHILVDDWRVDPDFVVFGAVASETDDLPVGKDRERWEAVALVEKDAEVKSFETRMQAKMYGACRNVTRRFTDV
ncbi:MAG TPA: hypothetical protein VII30_07720 [Gemmatimonadaceae bacterium]